MHTPDIAKWKFPISIKSTGIIAAGLLLNLLGRSISIMWHLPIWFDTAGTFVAACYLGPLGGLLTGVLSGILMCFKDLSAVYYLHVSALVGVVAGTGLYGRKRISSFTYVSTIMKTTIVATVLSVVSNVVLYDGYTGNVFGDGLVDMLSRTISSRIFCGIIGEGFVDFPDKIVSAGILFLCKLVSDHLDTKLEGHRPAPASLKAWPFILLPLLLLTPSLQSRAEDGDFLSSYAVTTYGIKEGLLSPEIRTIVQTGDGYIWAGGYSGLYRFNGQSFEPVNPGGLITTVSTLYADSRGRLWIGSNDNGLIVYDPITRETMAFDLSWSMPSESILSICEDSKQNIYVGTRSYLALITSAGIVGVYNSMEDLVQVCSLTANERGYIAGVTEEGMLFLFKDGQLLQTRQWDTVSGRYTTARWGRNGELLVGTSTNVVERFQMVDGQLESRKKTKTMSILGFNGIGYDPELDGYFCCADNGMGFLDRSGTILALKSNGNDHDLIDILLDDQKNVWVASARNGILKFSPSRFRDLSKMTDQSFPHVNCLYRRNNDLFIGTDKGLMVVDMQTAQKKDYAYLSDLDGMEIRHVTGDRLGNIWISGGTNAGLIKVNGSGIISFWHEGSEGVLGENFEQVLEMRNGDILAASDSGLSYISDGQVSRTIGEAQGLKTKKIHQILEDELGRILVATEDAGVIILENNRVCREINMASGLGNSNVKKMVPYNDGFLYLTSNAIYYDNQVLVRKLEHFPYNNNFDIFINSRGICYVLTSAGIYVTRAEELIRDEAYPYLLLNYKNGLNTTLVGEAFNTSRDDTLYMCCSDTVLAMDTGDEKASGEAFDIVLNHVMADEEWIPVKDGAFTIPKGTTQVSIYPHVLDYSLEDPCLHISLKGPEPYEEYVHQSDLKELQLSNLTSGSYDLIIEVVDELTGDVRLQKQYVLNKELQIFERLYFRIYLLLVSAVFVFFVAWIISKLGSLGLINRQYEEIREAKEAAEHANRVKSRFLAQMSHEIRTPINSVLGMDEMILRESKEKNIQEYAADIYNAGHTLLSMVNEILDFSKIESARMELSPVEYEVPALIHDLYNMVVQRAEGKGLKLEVDIDPSIPVKLYGDDVRIKQVITNLLTNAVKYTPTGTIWFRILGNRSGNEEILRVEVEDTGIGIRKEDMASLFEDYSRFDPEKNRYVEGTGLGLPIVRSLLKLMDSKLQVESTYGEGSCFYFTLTQQIVDETPMGTFETTAGSAKIRNAADRGFIAPDASILVVDDNSMNRRVLKSLLKRTRISISEAGGGEEAVELAGNIPFDMILMDHMMPGMDGVEAFRQIRAKEDSPNRNTPIYVLTANAVAGAREQYLEMGFDGFLSKPVVYDRLEQALEENLPREKILPAPMGEELAEDSVIKEQEPDDLPIVEGLDWAVAWLHLPKMDLLRESVKEFYELLPVHGEKLEKMYRALWQETSAEHMDAYRIQIHAMKSSAATLGIIPLAGMAKMLEFAAKDSNLDRITMLHPTFMEEWNSYREKLKGLFGIGEDTATKEAEEDILEGFLTVLSSAMEDMDVDTADEVMGRMKQYRFPESIMEQIPALSAAIADLDEETARQIIGKMRTSGGCALSDKADQ